MVNTFQRPFNIIKGHIVKAFKRSLSILSSLMVKKVPEIVLYSEQSHGLNVPRDLQIL